MVDFESRSIMAEEPRVTRFKINWGDQPTNNAPAEQQEQPGLVQVCGLYLFY